eukprot:382464-Pleurochrysis_carterae.AAC.1
MTEVTPSRKGKNWHAVMPMTIEMRFEHRSTQTRLPTLILRLEVESTVRNHAKSGRAPTTFPGSTRATEWVGKEWK